MRPGRFTSRNSGNKKFPIKGVLLTVALACVCAAIYTASGPRFAAVPETNTVTISETTQPMQTENVTEEAMPSTEPVTEATIVETEPAEEYVISFAGDCTIGYTEMLSYAGLGFKKTVGDDYSYPFQNVQCYFAEDDLTLVNFEGTLTDGGKPVAGKEFNFRGPTDYVNILLEGSIEAVSLANNHSGDYGKEGYRSTIETLDSAGISYVEEDNCKIVTIGEMKVGLYAASFERLNTERIRTCITSLKEQGAEFIIFSAHWGTENSYSPDSTQVLCAHAAIEAGADVVWGNHPHVLEPIEVYEGKYIFYSMGNFCFGGHTKPRDFDSAVIQMTILRQPDGTISCEKVDVYPVSISSVDSSNNYQPTPYDPGSEEYTRTLEKLGWEETSAQSE